MPVQPRSPGRFGRARALVLEGDERVTYPERIPARDEHLSKGSRSHREMDGRLVTFYRTAEDFHRYLPGHAARREELASLFRRYRRYFGSKVLDLGCGGGVLGTVLESTGRAYVGMDVNPDMIRAARKAARERGSTQRFVLGDITRTRLRGRFDTLTLLGNALGHLRARRMEDLLRQRRANVHRGSTFVIDYRDVVAMFWHRAWKPIFVEKHKRGRVVCRTRTVDFRKGDIHIRARPASGRWVVNYDQAVWSPFILEAVMRGQGWDLIRRTSGHSPVTGAADPFSWVELYRFGN